MDLTSHLGMLEIFSIGDAAKDDIAVGCFLQHAQYRQHGVKISGSCFLKAQASDGRILACIGALPVQMLRFRV